MKIKWHRALLLFEQFRSRRITSEDLEAADKKATLLEDKMDDFRLLIAMCKDSMAGRYAISKWNLSVVVATIIYVVSPLDAIPDMIPVLGWLDDISIVGYAISKLAEEMKRYQQFRKENSLSAE